MWLILAVFVCAVCAMLSMSVSGSENVAYAATTPKYKATFSYTLVYQMNTAYTTMGSGTNVTTTGSLTSGQYAKATLSAIYIYGSGTSGTGTLANGGSINSNAINISADSTWYQNAISIKNSSGTSVASSVSKSLSATLSDGTYTCSFTGTGQGWTPNARTFCIYRLNCSFTFVVDTTAPTVYGASASTTGKYTNAAFTVSASDNVSLNNLYMKSPSVSYYTAVGSSRTVTAGSTNGLYSFYAKDNAGNQSATYYVNYDNVKPTGAIKNSSGTTLSSSYTNGAFYYTATDAGGISYLQYKTPSNSSWTTYTSGTTIAASATNGTYSFRAVDKCGNISDEKSIILDTVKPVGTLYGGTAAITNGCSSNANYIKFIAGDTVSGVKTVYIKTPKANSYATYSNGSQYAEEGTYYFYSVDNAGNTSATYNITLDKTPPVLTCSQTSFSSTYRNTFTVSTSETSAKMYYKTPSMTSYALVSGNSYTVSDTAGNGKYYFYAIDTVGNKSADVFVNLEVIYPEAQLIKSTTDNSICITWDGSTSVGYLNGNTYTKGTWVKAEGAYTFIITNTYGRSTTYNFSIRHYYINTSTVPSTCTTQGYSVYKCSHCSTSYNADYTAVLGHSYKGTTTAPTCTEQGYTVYKCSKCSSAYTSNYTAAIGHDYVATVVPATCTEPGCTKHVCSHCQDEYETDVVTALGHNFTETAVQVTCTEEGCILHSCTLCGYEYKTDIVEPSGHSYLTEVTLAATCDVDGERQHICEKCGDAYTNVIPATGHAYQITDATTENGVTHRRYTCTTCGDEYEQDLGDQYEEVSNYVEYLFEQYSPYMWWVLLGTAGVWSIAMGVAFIIARKNEDKEKSRKMIVNYIIGMVIIAAILVGCPYLVRGIALLVT